jgi:twinkle protein|tara:strand:- start:1583 stop:3160 length:1578 start_codon:yes stop_codon:yes gene_type:complete
MSNRAHLPCPFEDCGSSDAFSWNETEQVGKCHSCDKGYPNKAKTFDWANDDYPMKERKPPVTHREIASGTYDDIRGIDPDVCQLYGIQLQMDAAGDPVKYAFKWPTNVKYRGYEEKKFWLKDKGSLDDLFGPDFNKGSSNRIYITEGEFDAASLYQILGKSFPVKSLPSATMSERFIKKNFEYLNSFKEVIYAGEQDAPGKAAAERLYELFPEKFFFVPMSKHKDANEFLMAGDADDLMWSARKPQRFSPDNFYLGDLDIEQTILTENPYSYVPTGHAGLDDKIRGLVKGGLTFVKAPRGGGKTEMVRFFECGLLKQDPDVKIAMMHMEEVRSTTYRSMATYELGINVRTKEDAAAAGVSEGDVIKAAQKIADDRTVVFELRSHDDPMKILDYVRMAATVYGVDYVFIDHVQRLAYLSQGGADGATSLLTAIGSRMAQLAKELDIGVVFISQVNDDGRTKYAGSLEEEAIICIKLERDVESEDEDVRNTTTFIVDKNRPFSRLGKAGSIYYEPETTVLSEVSYNV